MPVFCIFVVFINLVISQALPPSSVQLLYAGNFVLSISHIAVNWSQPANVCGGFQYQGTSFFEQQTQKTYVRYLKDSILSILIIVERT